uniref:6-bladed beta-propeller n=1 Tax=candidate division WOR-3 bacterium TaxID=2052148 RepID=A0A7V4CHK1_UNCW3
MDTGGYVFITNSSEWGILKYKYDWQRDSLIYIRNFSYNFIPLGIATMANDSLCPERSFWVCDSINNRIIKFDYDGNFQAQFLGLQSPRIIARGRSLNNQEYYLYVIDSNSRRIVRLKHRKDNNTTTLVNERTFDFEISEIEFDGTLWIADNSNSRLLRWKEDLSESIYTFGSYGTGRNQFKGINHITIPIGIKNNKLVYFDRMIIGERRWESDCGIQIYRLGVEVKDFKASRASNPYSVKIEFKLTDFAYVTLKVINLNTITLINNEYKEPGYYEITFYGNPGRYEAQIIAKSRFESIRNEPPIQDMRSSIFYISDQSGGGGGGTQPPPGEPPCPIIYPYSFSTYYEDNNILPISFSETTDYHILKENLKEEDGFYKIFIKEDYEDSSYFDKFSLLSISHNESLNIGIVNNFIFGYQNTISPISFIDHTNKDWRNEILTPFDNNYLSLKDSGYLIANFGEVSLPNGGIIVILLRSKTQLVGGRNQPFSSSETIYGRKNWAYTYWDLREELKNYNGELVINFSFLKGAEIDYLGLISSFISITQIETLKLVSAYHNLYGEITDIINEEDNVKIPLKKNENIFISFLAESSSNSPILEKKTYIFYTKGKYFRNEEEYLGKDLEGSEKIVLCLNKTYYKDMLEYYLDITGKIIIEIYDIKGSLVKRDEKLIKKKGNILFP